MNELKVFNYSEKEIRTIEREDGLWWVANDVCSVFGETNRNRAMQSLEDDEKGYTQIDTPGGKQKTAIVNEAGLYAMLFAMQPEKARGVSEEYISKRCEQLRKFKRWVTHEVLPSIRKHGAYMTPETLEAAILNPDTMIKLCTALKDEQDKRRALEVANSALTVENQIMAPKAGYFDSLIDRALNTGIRETAKELGVKEKDFVRFLLDKKYLYRDKKGKLQPYAQYADDLFVLKECFNEKTQWAGTQLLVTPKGRETFRLLFVGAA